MEKDDNKDKQVIEALLNELKSAVDIVLNIEAVAMNRGPLVLLKLEITKNIIEKSIRKLNETLPKEEIEEVKELMNFLKDKTDVDILKIEKKKK